MRPINKWSNIAFVRVYNAAQVFACLSLSLPTQDARKGVLFDDFPPVLQLQLKRFEYDFQHDIMVKVCACNYLGLSYMTFAPSMVGINL